jgi:exodeoxyribonuclease V alpha subunit
MNLLTDVIKPLSDKGVLRQLDYQFGRFIADNLSVDSDEMGFIAALLSGELGRGHICLILTDLRGEVQSICHKLGITSLGVNGLGYQAVREYIDSKNWPLILKRCALVGQHGESLPMMFDGQRLYLLRYWYYETQLAANLRSFGAPMSLKLTEIQMLADLLDQLFARQYSFLFSALQVQGQSAQFIDRQRLVCDFLDVVQGDELDWHDIDAVLTQASCAADLGVLDQLIANHYCLNWQKVAAAMALTRRFTVISGGPGTGKTTTVAKLLAALITQTAQSGRTAMIKLIAPTGKAAARLTESIGQAVNGLAVSPEIKSQIPTESSTIHRLLGAIPNSAEFRSHRQNKLHLDVLVVDEASMVDLPMMYKLVEALPAQARLILLGDKDQLSSVEAGAVLADICSFQQVGFSQVYGKLISQLTGFSWITGLSRQLDTSMADSLCMLQKSYRFGAHSGIGQLAKAINSGQASEFETVWQSNFSDIELHSISGANYSSMIKRLVVEYREYLQYLGADDIANVGPDAVHRQVDKAKLALKLFARCRLLCAVREGDFGVEGLNNRIERALAAQRLIRTQDELWYQGRPVMVIRNDHNLGLYNGDIGICMHDQSDEQQRLKVYFQLPDGSVKGVLPSRVPEHETAYCMTVHKSQGSEFEHTLFILPPDHAPILTRELIYTGVTRAKHHLSLYAEIGVLKKAIKLKTERASGLAERLV